MPTREERRERGLNHIRAWQSSGQSIHHYCETHGLKPSTFKYWKQCYDDSEPKPEQHFVPIQVESMRGFALEPLELHVSHHFRLTLPNTTDPIWLAKLLRELCP